METVVLILFGQEQASQAGCFVCGVFGIVPVKGLEGFQPGFAPVGAPHSEEGFDQKIKGGDQGEHPKNDHAPVEPHAPVGDGHGRFDVA